MCRIYRSVVLEASLALAPLGFHLQYTTWIYSEGFTEVSPVFDHFFARLSYSIGFISGGNLQVWALTNIGLYDGVCDLRPEFLPLQRRVLWLVGVLPNMPPGRARVFRTKSGTRAGCVF